MKLNAYTVYDNKALVYGTPWFAGTDGAAVRAFTDLANDSNTTVGRHPRDFSLFCVGQFDDQAAALTPILPVRHVVDAFAILIASNPTPLFTKEGDADYIPKVGA